MSRSDKTKRFKELRSEFRAIRASTPDIHLAPKLTLPFDGPVKKPPWYPVYTQLNQHFKDLNVLVEELDVQTARYFMEVFNDAIGPEIKTVLSCIRKLVHLVQQKLNLIKQCAEKKRMDVALLTNMHAFMSKKLKAITMRYLEIENGFNRKIARIESWYENLDDMILKN